jgi:outer membrane protein assembly factor BamB
VVCATEKWELLILDGATGQQVHRIKMDDWSDFQFVARRMFHPKVLLPALADGKLLVATYGKGPSQKAEGRLRAYDPTSGRILWEVPIPGGPDLAPMVVDGHVLTGGDGLVMAFNLEDGKLLWTADAGHKKDFGGGQVIEGHFIVSCGQDLLSLDPATGKVLWTAKTYAEPSVYGEDGWLLVFANLDGGPFSPSPKTWVMALNAGTGKQVWERKLGSSLMPWVQDGRVYCNAEEKVMARDLATGKLLWTVKCRTEPKLPLVPLGDSLLLVEDYQGQTTLHAMTPDSGQDRWTFTLDGASASGLGIPLERGFILPLPGGQLDLLR